MLYSIRHSSRQDQRIPLLLVYLGFRHDLDLSRHPHGSGVFMFYYCIEGKGHFMLNGKQMLLSRNQCAVTFSETPYSCQASEAGCSVHVLGLKGACCQELLLTMGIKEAGIYQISDTELFSRYMKQLLDLHQQMPAQESYSKICYGFLLDLSSQIHSISDTQLTALPNETIRLVLEYLETHYQEPFSLDILSAEVCLTKEYLCYLFKKEMHHTILQHLTILRIGQARLFLEQYPEKKACEIGRMCGFESGSYFGKKFREIVGITPEKYRRVNSVIV